MKLFHFPYLALQAIIRNMQPVEMFDLSLCSKRATAVVKQSCKIYNFWLDLQLSNTIWLGIGCTRLKSGVDFSFRQYSDEENRLATRRKVGDVDSLSVYWPDKNEVKTYCQSWDEMIEHASSHYKVLLNLFHPKVSYVLIIRDHFRDCYPAVIDWINLVESKSDTKLIGDSVSEKLNYDFNKNNYDTFQLLSQEEKKEVQHWEFHQSDRLTVEDIISLNCTSIALRGSSLSDTNLNRLIKETVSGWNARLEFVTIDVNRVIDIENVLDGINADIISPADERRFNGYGVNDTDELRFRLVLSNGRTCSVNFFEGEIGESIRLIVWKEESTNVM